MATDEHPKITLHWLDSSRAQRIVWLLEELKLPYDVEVYKRDEKTHLAPDSLKKVHPLGKSPLVTIKPPGDGGDDIVLAESGFMTEYLVDHSPEGKRLVPDKWKPGMEGKIGGETEEWMRYRYFMHYAEGSLMPTLVVALIMSILKGPQVPFIVRPIIGAAANKVISMFVFPNAKLHLSMIEERLKTSSGDYLCGKTLTAADILMSFPLVAAKSGWDDMGSFEGGSWSTAFPRVAQYVELLESLDGYKRSEEKMLNLAGESKPLR